jgi:menaquinone-dependent protoporphyrinogen oxidase
MKVLVATASRHGSTTEVAEAVAAALAEAGLAVDALDAAAVTDLGGYDAAVLGSAVYMGRWLPPARELAQRHEGELAAIPVWLFSSGPLGEPPHPEGEPAEVEELAARIAARGHAVFAGRLERADLGRRERAVVGLVKAPYGDYRAWEEIRGWAQSIAAELTDAQARS